MNKAIKNIDQFKAVLKNIALGEHRQQSLINKSTMNSSKMKSTKNSTKKQWLFTRPEAEDETKIFKDFCIRYGFGSNQEYKQKIRIITQPFQAASEKLSFDRNIIPGTKKADEKYKIQEEEIIKRRINLAKKEIEPKKSPITNIVAKVVKKQIIVEEPTHKPKLNPFVPKYLKKVVNKEPSPTKQISSYKERFLTKKKLESISKVIKALPASGFLAKMSQAIANMQEEPKPPQPKRSVVTLEQLAKQSLTGFFKKIDSNYQETTDDTAENNETKAEE